MISKSNDFNKVIFTGDVSVTNQTTKLFCERNENFYYIMTGMVIKTLIYKNYNI